MFKKCVLAKTNDAQCDGLDSNMLRSIIDDLSFSRLFETFFFVTHYEHTTCLDIVQSILSPGPRTPDPGPQRAIFFDRDGVINARIVGGYVRHWSEFELLPDVIETLREVRRRGYLAIIVTNQRGVGLSIMTEAELNAVHDELQRAMEREAGTSFDDIIFCTDLDNVLGRRKPSPTMLFEAREKWNIDLANSWMIGDSMSDIEAGQRAGTKTAYLVTQHSEEIPKATKIIHHLRDILAFL